MFKFFSQKVTGKGIRRKLQNSSGESTLKNGETSSATQNPYSKPTKKSRLMASFGEKQK